MVTQKNQTPSSGAGNTGAEESAGVEEQLMIAFGASAGGLDALKTIFSCINPNSGHSFILIQHLSPDHKSLMSELLARKTSMTIRLVENGMIAEANTIYLTPPRHFLEIHQNTFKLMPCEDDQEDLFYPIDAFYRSLAADKKEKAVAVVLSGSGSDGARGVETIAARGGRIYVQDPKDAQFDSMPLATLSTGLVDEILTAENIAKLFNKPLRRPVVIEADLEDSHFAKLFDLMFKNYQIDFNGYKLSTISRQLQRRMAVKGAGEFDKYLAVLVEHPEELNKLKDALLVGYTRFFRDSEAFEVLESEIIAELLSDSSKSTTLRCWSLGCSTGEEAFSLAIAFHDQMEKLNVRREIRIFATDVDENAVAKASLGIFSPAAITGISAQRRHHYLKQQDGNYIVNAKIRRSVIFAQHNIATDPPFSNLDLVVCRNLLIYFLPELQHQILTSITFALKKQSYLFLGPSETLGKLGSHYVALDEKNRLYQKISAPSTRFKQSNKAQHLTARTDALINEVKTSQAALQDRLLGRLAQRQPNGMPMLVQSNIVRHLLNVWMPPTILINENRQAVYIYGDASRYTKKVSGGRVSNSYKVLLREPLGQAVSNAIDKARQNHQLVIFRDIELWADEQDITLPDDIDQQPGKETVDIRVEYLAADHFEDHLYALTFLNYSADESKNNNPDSATLQFSESYSERFHTNKRIEELEEELLKSQDLLQVTIEELETTNEELQASNEELMSANEELQSTNEELHSLNEELYTVNSEYQEKISDLTLLSDDYSNILNATHLAIVMLDHDLIIRKFTDEMKRYFRLMKEDVGRPLEHFATLLEYEDLCEDIKNVMEKRQSLQRHVKLKVPLTDDDTGATSFYLPDLVIVDMRPCIDSYNELNGSVLVISRIAKV